MKFLTKKPKSVEINDRLLSDFMLFNKQGENCNIHALQEDMFPCLNDSTQYTAFDAHYIYHPAWACRIVKKISPIEHIDISSTLHFCSMLSAFIPVHFYDYRPAKLTLSNLKSDSIDLVNLSFETGSIKSLSCMHTIEHIGLGRYGDPIDVQGDIKAINEIKRVVASSGNVLIVLPVGKPKIMFNAHRIYSADKIVELFDGFDLIDFSIVLDDQQFIENAKIDLAHDQNYACGCFWFKKR